MVGGRGGVGGWGGSEGEVGGGEGVWVGGAGLVKWRERWCGCDTSGGKTRQSGSASHVVAMFGIGDAVDTYLL